MMRDMGRDAIDGRQPDPDAPAADKPFDPMQGLMESIGKDGEKK